MIPGEREHRFRPIVSTIPAHCEQPKRLMLENSRVGEIMVSTKVTGGNNYRSSPEGVSIHQLKEVLGLTAAGLSQRQIARSLQLSTGARDKAKVEVAVQVVERWILARLRHRTFHSLFELHLAIRELLTALSERPFKKLPGSNSSGLWPSGSTNRSGLL